MGFRVFHTVFNTCGKLVGKVLLLHSFSAQFPLFCHNGCRYSCGLAKMRNGGKVLKSTAFGRHFSPFPQEFSTHRQKENATRSPKGIQNKREPQKALFSTCSVQNYQVFFHTQKASHVRQKRHTVCVLGLSTVSAPPTINTIYYLYHSFVLSASPGECAERSRKEQFYENRIQPSICKRCSSTSDVRSIRQVHAHRSRGYFN